MTAFTVTPAILACGDFPRGAFEDIATLNQSVMDEFLIKGGGWTIKESPIRKGCPPPGF